MSQSAPHSVSDGVFHLTPTQEHVLALLSAGSTMTAAAESAGIHRNTIMNWRRNSWIFRQILLGACQEKAIFWQEQAEQLAASAIATIRAILDDPAAPAGVRLKAALAILDKAATPPPPEKMPIDAVIPAEDLPQPPLEPQPEPDTPRPVVPSQNVHKNAQSLPSQISSSCRNVTLRGIYGGIRKLAQKVKNPPAMAPAAGPLSSLAPTRLN